MYTHASQIINERVIVFFGWEASPKLTLLTGFFLLLYSWVLFMLFFNHWMDGK